MTRYLTPDQAAERLGVHTRTVFKWIDAGKLPALQARPHMPVQIDAADVERLYRERGGDAVLPGGLSVNEVAERLGTAPRTVRRYLADGELGYHQVREYGPIVVTEADLAAFLRERTPRPRARRVSASSR